MYNSEAISPKNKQKPTATSEVIILTTPAEEVTMKSNEIIVVNTKDKEVKEKEDKQPQNNEKHGTMGDNIDSNTEETR